jgi:hypothetical protein
MTHSTRTWPLGFDPENLEDTAGFLLRLGYGREEVAGTVAKRGKLDPITAQRIVADAAKSNTEDHS